MRYFLSLPDDGSILVMNQWGSWTVKGRVTPVSELQFKSW